MRHAAALFVCALLFAGAAPAADLTPQEAKALADKSEASLGAVQYGLLVEQQGVIGRAAFPTCADKVGDPPDRFTVVVEIDTLGRVVNSWTLEDHPFAQCIRREMELRFSFRPPQAPFYSSFSYTRSQNK